MTIGDIRRELKMYYEYQREVDALGREIAQLKAEKDRILSAGSKNDGQPRGSDTSDPTYAQARLRIDHFDAKIARALERQKEYLSKLSRIDRWLDMLPAIRRGIIREKYCKLREWHAVAREFKYSVSYCKALTSEAIEFIAKTWDEKNSTL